MKRRVRAADIRKLSVLSIVINSVQILLMLIIVLAVIFGEQFHLSAYSMRALTVFAALVVSWGAIVDIRDAVSARHTQNRMNALNDSMGDLEQLNLTLRAQRHDFMNHLQVVYSLMELGDYDEAMGYIDRTYGDIVSVSGVMKTASPAINALLMAKSTDCKASGIEMQLKIASAYDALPMESWELCRVLGNLIDNAADALDGTQDPCIEVELSESVQFYAFRVTNNGPAIPKALQQKVFETGFTTKAKGTGMGLFICKKILEGAGGELTLTSDEERTEFAGRIPKDTTADSGQKTNG